jgi:hypothetical protein
MENNVDLNKTAIEAFDKNDQELSKMAHEAKINNQTKHHNEKHTQYLIYINQ